MRVRNLLGLFLFLIGASARSDEPARRTVPGPTTALPPDVRSMRSPSVDSSGLSLPPLPPAVADASAARPARPYLPKFVPGPVNRKDLKDFFTAKPSSAFGATAADCSSWAENDFPYTPIMLGDRSPFAGLLAGPAVPSTLGTRYPFQGKRCASLVSGRWYSGLGLPHEPIHPPPQAVLIAPGKGRRGPRGRGQGRRKPEPATPGSTFLLIQLFR